MADEDDDAAPIAAFGAICQSSSSMSSGSLAATEHAGVRPALTAITQSASTSALLCLNDKLEHAFGQRHAPSVIMVPLCVQDIPSAHLQGDALAAGSTIFCQQTFPGNICRRCVAASCAHYPSTIYLVCATSSVLLRLSVNWSL